MALLKRISKGATIIENNTAVNTICAGSSAMMPAPSASASSAKPNSPPTATSNPTRHAVSASIPAQLPSPATSRVLTPSNARAPTTAQCQIAGIAEGSTSIPMPTKNSPSKTSRNGLIVASI